MVQSIARYAVIRKTDKEVNILTGNYEAAYAEGLLFQMLQIDPDPSVHSVKELQLILLKSVEGWTPPDERTECLIHMLKEYKPSDIWDEDVEQLFEQGKNEKRIWELQP